MSAFFNAKAHPQIVHYHALEWLLFVLVTVFLQGFVICFTSLGRRTEFTPPHRISSTKKKFSRDWVARVARFSYTNPSNFRRSLPPLLLRYIYDWTFSDYLILICSFSSCRQYFSKRIVFMFPERPIFGYSTDSPDERS